MDPLMAKLDSYRCDEPQCGKERTRDSNRWYVLFAQPTTDGCILAVHEWNEISAASEGASHACGEEHATAMFQRWLQTGQLLPPSSRPISKSEKSAESVDSPAPTGKEEA